MTEDKRLRLIAQFVDETQKGFKDFNSNISETQKNSLKLGESFVNLAVNLAKVAVAVGTAGVALGTFAVKQASDFEKSMSNIATLVNTSTESMEAMKEQVLDISKKTPVALGDLTAALYNVRSAGISAKDAMGVLELSAKLGVAGLGTTDEAVNLATSAINAFGYSGENVSDVFNIMQLTVKSGKTTIAQLAQSFGNVAGVAKTAGVGLEELQAATAGLTAIGQQASVAQNQLRAAILAIQAPGTDMEAVIKKLGYSSGEAMLKQLGLVGSMEAINKAVNGDVSQLKAMYGSVEALGAAISLTGAQNGIFNETLKTMKNSAGALDEAFNKQNETLDAQLQILKNNLGAAMIQLGTEILPSVKRAVGELIDFLKDNEKQIKKVAEAVSVILVPMLKFLLNAITFVIDSVIYLSELYDDNARAIRRLRNNIDDFIENSLKVLTKLYKENRQELTLVQETIMMFISNGLNLLRNAFYEVKEMMEKYNVKLSDVLIAIGLLYNPIGVLIDMLITGLAGAFNKDVKNAITDTIKKMTDLGIFILSKLTEYFIKGAQIISSTVRGLIDFFDGDFTVSIFGMSEAVKVSVLEMYNRFIFFVDDMEKLFKRLVGAFTGFSDDALLTKDNVVSYFSQLYQSIFNTVSKIINFVFPYLSSGFDFLLDATTAFLSGFIGAWESGIGKNSTVFGSTGDQIENLKTAFKNLWEALKVYQPVIIALIQSIGGAMGTIASDFILGLNTIITGFNMFVEGVRGIMEVIKVLINAPLGSKIDALTKAIPTISNKMPTSSNLIYRAEGGFVPKGTDTVPAMLSPGELILNAAQQRNLAGNMGITINISGNSFNGVSKDTANEIFEILQQKLQRNLKFSV